MTLGELAYMIHGEVKAKIDPGTNRYEVELFDSDGHIAMIESNKNVSNLMVAASASGETLKLAFEGLAKTLAGATLLYNWPIPAGDEIPSLRLPLTLIAT